MSATDAPSPYTNIGTHATHCCSRHGCAYSGMGKRCPVKEGVVEQEVSCEQCMSSKSIKEKIARLQDELVWSEKMEAEGFTLNDDIYGY